MSGLADLYDRAYAALAGNGVGLRPWHFQWLAARRLHPEVKRAVGQFQGRVLDVGCGDKPYVPSMAPGVSEVVGIDIYDGAKVDVVVAPGRAWPFETASFDGVLCTEVLEHVEGLAFFLEEIQRVIKPGGLLIATVPFVYPFHGNADLTGDYRRFTVSGLGGLLSPWFQPMTVIRCGAAGSVCGYTVLLTLDGLMGRSFAGRLLKGLLLPLHLPLCLVINGGSRLLDLCDPDQIFYTHSIYIGRKKS